MKYQTVAKTLKSTSKLLTPEHNNKQICKENQAFIIKLTYIYMLHKSEKTMKDDIKNSKDSIMQHISLGNQCLFF